MDNHQEVISRLKFIGKLQKGEKINTRNMSVQSNGMITRFLRTVWQQDNRINCISFIQETMRRSFDLFDKYDTSSKEAHVALKENMIADLRESMNGLVNLKTTYTSDVKFCCDIDTLLQLILVKLSEKEMYDNFNTYTLEPENGNEIIRDISDIRMSTENKEKSA
jgi:hypothetical protein